MAFSEKKFNCCIRCLRLRRPVIAVRDKQLHLLQVGTECIARRGRFLLTTRMSHFVLKHFFIAASKFPDGISWANVGRSALFSSCLSVRDQLLYTDDGPLHKRWCHQSARQSMNIRIRGTWAPVFQETLWRPDFPLLSLQFLRFPYLFSIPCYLANTRGIVIKQSVKCCSAKSMLYSMC